MIWPDHRGTNPESSGVIVDVLNQAAKEMRIKTQRIRSPCLLGMFLASVWAVTGTGVATALEVGEKAPEFELQSTTGDKIRLSDFAGKKNVLVEFYGADFAPT